MTIINQGGADAFSKSFDGHRQDRVDPQERARLIAEHRQDVQELAEEGRKLVTRDSSSDAVAGLLDPTAILDAIDPAPATGTVTLQVRIPVVTRNRALASAEAAGVTLSEYVRQLLQGTRRPLQSSIPPELLVRVRDYGDRTARGLDVTLETVLIRLLTRALDDVDRKARKASR
jgi:hypothetical protein